MERLNARNRAAQSMFQGAVFSESLKLVTRRISFGKDSYYSQVAELGGFQLLGPARYMNLRDMNDGGIRMKQLFSDYLGGKFGEISDDVAKVVVQKLRTWTFHARIRFLLGGGTQTVSLYLDLGGSQQRKKDSRACHFVAVEMDEDGDTCHTYYGRHLRLVGVDLSDSVQHSHPWFCRYNLGVFHWAHDLRVGPQGQVYFEGRSETLFRSSTMEDVSILRRLIGVVPHRVPRRNGCGTKLRSYFINDHARLGY
ncbi:hypothetical protein FGB62_57g05 [Gracilaria domingensis]|nr:hypothetical protein FGB62_57g05 [Gracilaria domingensis]